MSSGSSGKMPGKKKKYNARFPPARIKKIMQKDEEVGKVAAPVPVIISRALELFVESLLTRAGAITESRHARTLTPAHLKQCILAERRFDFLQELVSTVADINPDGESGEMSPGIFGSGLLTSPVASATAAGTPPHTPLTPGTPIGAGGSVWGGEGTPSHRGRGVVGRVRGGRGRGRGGRGKSGSDGVHYQPRPRGRPKKVPPQTRMVMDDMDSDEGLSVDIDSEEEEDEESETDEEVIEVAESHSITNHAAPSPRKEIPPLAPLPHTIPPVPDLKPINTSSIISHTKSFETTPKIPGLQISIGGSYSNLAAGIKSGVSSDSPSKNSFPFSPTSSTPNALPSSFSTPLSPLSSGIQISFLSPTDKVSIKSNNSSPKNTITITPTSSSKSSFPSSSPKVSSSNPFRSPVSSPSSAQSVLHSPGINSPSSIPPQSPVSASAKPSFGVPVPVITSVHAMRFPLPAPQRQISQTEVDEDYDT